jgi:hypothetical protein
VDLEAGQDSCSLSIAKPSGANLLMLAGTPEMQFISVGEDGKSLASIISTPNGQAGLKVTVDGKARVVVGTGPGDGPGGKKAAAALFNGDVSKAWTAP